jgi:membrane protease YdiL (CAAX protease family)
MASIIGQSLGGPACTFAGLTVLVLISPITEEVIFRVGIQSYLAKKFPGHFLHLSSANLLTAVLFAGSHALIHGTMTDLLVAAPALLLGWCWEISGKRISAPILLHSWFNFCLAWISC